MNIIITSYDVYWSYDQYEPDNFYQSFDTLEEAVICCEERNKIFSDAKHYITVNYKIN